MGSDYDDNLYEMYSGIKVFVLEEKKNIALNNASTKPMYLIFDVKNPTDNPKVQSDLEKAMASDLEKAMADSLGISTSDISVTLKFTTDDLSIHYKIVGNEIIHYERQSKIEFIPILEYYMHKYDSLKPIVKTSSSYKITKFIYEQNILERDKETISSYLNFFM